MTGLTLVRHKSGKEFLAYPRKLPWKGNDIAWFRPMKFLGFKWEKVYNKKDIECYQPLYSNFNCTCGLCTYCNCSREQEGKR